MDTSSGGKTPNSSFSIRYHVSNDEIEEVFLNSEDDLPAQSDTSLSTTINSENASPKRLDRSGSLIDKYFKSMRQEKLPNEKQTDVKEKTEEKSSSQKDANSSPMKEYLNRFGKKKELDGLSAEGKDGPNETWKIFQDFKVKITQAMEEMKTPRADEKDKSTVRDSSVSDSEENSAVRDADQQSVGDTDNQVSSLHSSYQNLSEQTQPLTAKGAPENNVGKTKTTSESSDDTHKLDNEEELNEEILYDDAFHDIESGVEAFEDTQFDAADALQTSEPNDEIPLPDYIKPSIASIIQKETRFKAEETEYYTFFNIPLMIFTTILVLSHMVSSSDTFNGFIFGLWTFSLCVSAKEWLANLMSDKNETEQKNYFENRKSAPREFISNAMPEMKEHKSTKNYEGWINHYRFTEYDPLTYNINRTTTAFMKLEDCSLRISYTLSKVSRKATWDEDLSKKEFYKHRLYNLKGARIILLPKGLVSKRLWSKKYPMCIILDKSHKVQFLERKSLTEKDGSPEKTKKEEELADTSEGRQKKKFIRGKKDRDNAESSGSKIALRNRFTWKLNKDKKSEECDPPTCTKEGCTDEQCVKDNEILTLYEEKIVTEEIKEYNKIKEIIDESEVMETTSTEARESVDEQTEWFISSREITSEYLFIFARTGRDKHEWYRRIRKAILDSEKGEGNDESGSEHHDTDNVFRLPDKDAIAFSKLPGSSYNIAPEPISVRFAEDTLRLIDLEAHERDFWPYIHRIIQQGSTISMSSPIMHNLPVNVGWINAAIGRIAYDAMRNPEVVARIQKRIQRKLNILKLPAVVSGLLATELSLGSLTPLVDNMEGPTCDEKGLWIYADIHYDGGAYITLNTKINLRKLNEKDEEMEQFSDEKTDPSEATSPPEAPSSSQTPPSVKKKSAIYHSDVEDSAESSSDEDTNSLAADAAPLGENPTSSDLQYNRSSVDQSGAKKFLRMVDKITASKYFQQISDYKVVKLAMEGLSNTEIKLHLELKGLEGRLAFNFPPPPHNRVWIGFRDNPRIWLKAKPALGTHTVRISHITNWIEQKLCKEFEKVFVMPNMEDITIDLLTPTPVEFE